MTTHKNHSIEAIEMPSSGFAPIVKYIPTGKRVDIPVKETNHESEEDAINWAINAIDESENTIPDAEEIRENGEMIDTIPDEADLYLYNEAEYVVTASNDVITRQEDNELGGAYFPY